MKDKFMRENLKKNNSYLDTSFYIDEKGKIWEVDEMSTKHIKQVLKDLERNSSTLRMNRNDAHNQISLFDKRWVRSTRLYKNMEEEISSRE